MMNKMLINEDYKWNLKSEKKLTGIIKRRMNNMIMRLYSFIVGEISI